MSGEKIFYSFLLFLGMVFIGEGVYYSVIQNIAIAILFFVFAIGAFLLGFLGWKDEIECDEYMRNLKKNSKE